MGVVRPDGVRRWLLVNSVPIVDSRQILGSVATFLDITERKRTEENLQRANKQVASILESISDAFFALDDRWCFTYLNAEAGRILGKTGDQLLGKSVWDEFPEAVGSTFFHEYRRAMAERVTVAFEEFYPPMNRWFSVHAYPSPSGLSVYFQDVTERKAAEEALRRYKLLAEYARDIILFVDRDGRIVEANNAALQAYGYEREELLALSIYDLRAGETAALIPDQLAQADAGGILFESIHRRKDGSTFPVEVSSQGTTIGNRRVLLSIVRDITERKRAEQFREEYLSLISHDLRTPLTVILGQADFLRLALERIGNRRLAGGAEAIVASGKRMRAMIQDLVDTARLEAGQISLHQEPVVLQDLLREVAARAVPLADQPRVQLDLAEEPVTVLGDRERLERVIVNLVTNALKYSDADQPVAVRLVQRAHEGLISIVDRGVGISQPDLPHVFDRFFRATNRKGAEGLGLGLYIARLIVHAHGGRIWAESEPGKGSAFRFALPLLSPPPARDY
jgi:PAS domain S-box-containing protein